MKRKVVFIMGTGHCGSTLVDLILGSNDQAFSLGEIHTFDEQKVIRVNGQAKLCGVCNESCRIWNRKYFVPILSLFFSQENFAARQAGKLARYLINPYALIMKWVGKPMLIDSSKQPTWIKKQLKPEYAWRDIEVFLLYVLRDGRAVVNSFHRKYPERGIDNIIDLWMKKTRAINKYFEKFNHGKKMKIKYEDLASDPYTNVEKLCSFLDIPYSIDMLGYWKHDHHHIGGNKGTKSLILSNLQEKPAETPSENQLIEEINSKIQLDLRWKSELSNAEIQTFESKARELNNALGY